MTKKEEKVSVRRAIFDILRKGQWMTLETITAEASERVGRDLNVTTVGSSLRGLRSSQGVTINTRRRGIIHRRSEYRLVQLDSGKMPVWKE